jgi:hypothetical protein
VVRASELSKRRHDGRREAPEEASGQPAVIVDDDAKRVLVQV